MNIGVKKTVPGIGFRAGNGGREAYLIGHRIAVWEVLEIYRTHGRLVAAAEQIGCSPAVVQRALAFARMYPAAIGGSGARKLRPGR